MSDNKPLDKTIVMDELISINDTKHDTINEFVNINDKFTDKHIAEIQIIVDEKVSERMDIEKNYFSIKFINEKNENYKNFKYLVNIVFKLILMSFLLNILTTLSVMFIMEYLKN